MDSGHAGEKALGWPETHGVGYVVEMRMKRDLRVEALGLPWNAYEREETDAGPIASCSLPRKSGTCSRSRRLVVVRWGPETDRAESDLFDVPGYTCALFVTRLDGNERDVYRFCDRRADVENRIREAKHDPGIGHMAAGQFQPSAADLELRLLAEPAHPVLDPRAGRNRAPAPGFHHPKTLAPDRRKAGHRRQAPHSETGRGPEHLSPRCRMEAALL